MALVTRPIAPPKRITTRANVSPACARAVAAFGVVAHRDPRAAFPAPSLDDDTLARLRASTLTLVAGHSGSGKTTLLRELRRLLAPIAPAPPKPDPSRCVLDQFPLNISDTLALLSRVGLAQPALWARCPRELSAGERARFDLARQLAHARPGDTLLLDEFGSTLDRATCASVASAIRRLALDHRVRIVAAGAHEDLPLMLDTDTILDAPSRTITPNRFTPEPIAIEPGTRADLGALKHHHYRTHDPASIAHILRATRTTHAGHTILAGVLVVTYPTLNARWRTRAYPGRFDTGSPRDDARRLNAEVRTIARVIVEPRSRALGIASALVRAYLARPLTPITEALASMGAVSPFFERAGMTGYRPHRAPSDLRLLDALDHEHRTPLDLLDPSAALPPLIERELQTWSRTRKHDPNDPSLRTHAGASLIATPLAYAHTARHTPRGDHDEHEPSTATGA